MKRWIQEDIGDDIPFAGIDVQEWMVDMDTLKKVIRRAGNSAPGPDGIPYKAWQALGDLGLQVLFGVLGEIGNEDLNELLKEGDVDAGEGEHSFNLGLMIFLPKKISGTDPLMGDYYTPNDVRPLMVVNTDNRLLANALRHKWEPMLDRWISANQQGFLPNRSMASNIVEVDHQAHLRAAGNKKAGILLLDFKAAFPSINHSFMHIILEALGLPAWVLNSIKNLYCDHRCSVNFGSTSIKGFDILSGIRQGCPISPLIFATVLDIALRRLQRIVPNATVKAFADDIAIVVDDVEEALGLLEEFFRDLEQIAGLDLNKKKCILIPLWQGDLREIQNDIARKFQFWAPIQVEYKGMYLGTLIGPESNEHFWDKAVKKFMEAATAWGKLGLGLQYTTVAYTTYILPRLSFLAQFKVPSKEVYEAELKALRRMIPGPYNWCLKDDCYLLGKCYGQARSFPT